MAINNSPAALSSGTLVYDRFRVKKVLGYGGYGNVYLVEDEIVFPGNQYALKESLSSTISEQKQFTREADWLKKLEHPNLPRVLEQFQWNGRPYFVMAYVAGENLEDRVDRLGPLPEDQVLAWMMPICDAVIYLHTQKRPIIHRDIKPGNIIVSKDGRPWLVDFGIAKMLQSGASRKTTRAARAVSGGYSPLEQYTRGGTDARSDVYALGATFYHLLTGICPPEAPDIASGVARLPEARQVHPKISRQTDQVIMRAMAQKPEDRYQSVREMVADLTAGRPFTISPNGTASQPVTSATKSRRGVRSAKNAPAPVPATAAAAVVAAPPQPHVTPARAPAAVAPPDVTLVSPPPVPPQHPLPPTLVAQPPVTAMSFAPPQPGQSLQAGALPMPNQPTRRRRVVLAGLVALLCGVGVLATMVLTVLYPNNEQHLPFFVQGYGDVIALHDVSLDALLTLVPVAALLLVILPLFNWVGRLGRAWTYLFLLVVPLLGLAPIILWLATGPTNVLNSILGRGFYVPIALFVITWAMSVTWAVRRR
jgi:serine/threonine protein kinase